MGRASRDRALMLTGMMGAGKTCVGQLLARRLGWDFIDTDERVERARELPIAQIFAREGEAAFRALERVVLDELPDRGVVIALGGGALGSPESRSLLRDKGTLVWLDAPAETLAARVGAAAERPLLAGLDADARIECLRQLRREREPAYGSADLRVETGERTPEEVSAAVLAALGWEDGRCVTTVQVMLGERSYPVRIRPDSLGEIGGALAAELEVEHLVVLTTRRVGGLYYDALASGIVSAGVRLDRLEAPDGERAKTLRHAARLYDSLLELGAQRQTAFLGLGGGALSDLAGFVASTYLRGVPLVQVPTTLLSQVDASVGGKTAVNHPRGKNLIGSFYQPRLVWIDPSVLASLPRRELRGGLAEVVKAAALWDAEFFAWLEENVDAVMKLEPEPLQRAIARAVAIKAEIVGLDEREAGLRALLNFGHTLAHAVENVARYRRIHHGEAVAIGMVFAARVSQKAGLIDESVTARLTRLLERIGLPTVVPDWKEQRNAYLRAISVDKKVRGDRVGFVVLRELGRAEQMQLSTDELLAGAA